MTLNAEEITRKSEAKIASREIILREAEAERARRFRPPDKPDRPPDKPKEMSSAEKSSRFITSSEEAKKMVVASDPPLKHVPAPVIVPQASKEKRAAEMEMDVAMMQMQIDEIKDKIDTQAIFEDDRTSIITGGINGHNMYDLQYWNSTDSEWKLLYAKNSSALVYDDQSYLRWEEADTIYKVLQRSTSNKIIFDYVRAH